MRNVLILGSTGSIGTQALEVIAASEELRAITGEYFGYHFDLPRRERDEALDRWRTWWYDPGRGR